MHVTLISLFVPLLLAHGGGDDDDEEHHDDAAAVAAAEIVEKAPIDNGQINAEVDLPPSCRTAETWGSCPEWTCETDQWAVSTVNETMHQVKDQKADFGGHKSEMTDQHQEELYPNSGYPHGLPNSGYHRPKWPEYGEYRYIPPLRYVHALEHGAMLFLHHPCAPVELVDRLRALARGCLWKHLVFGFKGDLTPEYPLALISYGTIMRVSDITPDNIADLRKWVRDHSKTGANGEGRVYGNGTYNLLLIHPADIVTEIEDNELCPGDDKIDASLFTYNDDDKSSKSTTDAPPPPPTVPKTEKPKSTTTTTTTTKAVKTEAALVEEEEDEDVLTPEDYVEQEIDEEANDDDDVITEPKTTTTTMPTTEKEPTTEKVATTVTTHRLIVGTPPETSITAEYSIDEQYDDYEKVDDESNVNFDTAEAQQEALVQIKRSEGFWAFLSCTVLVVVLTLALYKSQLCRRKHKGYMRNNDHWTEDDQSISVGTLVRNLRKKNSIDETKYSLLQNEEDHL